jgi:hypothetical protein
LGVKRCHTEGKLKKNRVGKTAYKKTGKIREGDETKKRGRTENWQMPYRGKRKKTSGFANTCERLTLGTLF